jgi:spore coat polysaccharide biosynthesis protein SpsF (cytidylyltransferase family)
MNITLITQARSGSTRLPGKVLKKIEGKTLLQIHIERIKKAKLLHSIYIATTINSSDDVIEEMANELDVKCYRGSENDVLDRFYQTVKDSKPDYVVRLTSDCPLIDPLLIDEVVREAIKSKVDYYSNGLEDLYPDGQDIEIFKFSALETAWKDAKLISEREHVTPFIRNNSSYFGKTKFTSKNHGLTYNYNKVRLTVDEPEDFEVIKKIIEALGTDVGWRIYADYYLNNKEISLLNNNIKRNEGYLKSLKQDKS